MSQATAQKSTTAKYAVGALKLALTVLVVALLYWAVEWRRVIEALAGIRWSWISLALLIVLARNAVDALEMHVVLAKIGLRVGMLRIFLNNALGNLYALVLPGAVLAKGVKFGGLAAAAGTKSAVLNAMVYNGMIQLLPPLVFGLAALVYDNPLPQTHVVNLSLAFGGLTVAGLALLYHPTLGIYTLGTMRNVARRFPRKFAKRLSSSLDAVERFQSFKMSDHLLVLAIATVAMTLSLARLACGFAAMGIDVPVFRVAWIYIFLRVLRLLPLTIGNLGIREGVLIAALARFDVPAATAIAMGLVLYCDRLFLALVGLVYQVCLMVGLARLRPAEPSPIVPIGTSSPSHSIAA